MQLAVHCSLPLGEQSRMGGVRTSWPSQQQQQQPSWMLTRQPQCRCTCQHRDSAPQSAAAPISRRHVLTAPFAVAVVAAALQQRLPASALTLPVQGYAPPTGSAAAPHIARPLCRNVRFQRSNSALRSCNATAGKRRHEDKLDGYTFDFPDVWIPVTVCP